MIDVGHSRNLKTGKHYLTYRKANGVFKRVSIYKYESIFTTITQTIYSDHEKIITDLKSPVQEHDDIVIFELNEDEVFSHFMMEEIIINL